MALPKTLDEMRAMGYKFQNHGVCKACGDDVEWWETPHGKTIPINEMDKGTSRAIAHWTVCSGR